MDGIIARKNVKERHRVDTNNSFNKNNTNIIYSAGTFKINPFNINEAVDLSYNIGRNNCGLKLKEDYSNSILLDYIKFTGETIFKKNAKVDI